MLQIPRTSQMAINVYKFPEILKWLYTNSPNFSNGYKCIQIPRTSQMATNVYKFPELLKWL
jgi:hypothetical protein